MERQMIVLVQAVHRYYREDVVPSLRRAAKGIPDGRSSQGKTWDLGNIMGNLIVGKLTDMRTLRQVEMLSDLASGRSDASFGGRRMSDSTGHDTLTVTPEGAINT